MAPGELRPVGTHEWVQILRRARLDGLIGGNRGRGGVSGLAFKGVALVLASYADGDTGLNVRPGDATVAVEAETSLRTVKLVKAKLIEMGLLRRTRAGARRSGNPDEYQLTLPVDLFELVEVLSPAQVRVRAQALNESQRRPRTGSSGHHTTEPAGAVMRDPEDTTQPDVRCPVDTTQHGDADGHVVSSGPATNGCVVSTGPVVWCPEGPPTNQDQPPNLTNHPDGDLRTDLTLVRATGSVEDPDSAMGGGLGWGVPPPPAVAERARRGAQMARLSIAKRDEADVGPSLRLVEAAS